jgi:hypothetical protein
VGAGVGLDHRGSRRLGGAEQWIWYVVAGISYVGFAVWHKWVLNWFVGPAWLVGVVAGGPWLFDRARRQCDRVRDALGGRGRP